MSPFTEKAEGSAAFRSPARLRRPKVRRRRAAHGSDKHLGYFSPRSWLSRARRGECEQPNAIANKAFNRRAPSTDFWALCAVDRRNGPMSRRAGLVAQIGRRDAARSRRGRRRIGNGSETFYCKAAASASQYSARNFSFIFGALTALLATAPPSITETAAANGDTRTINLFYVHTGESILRPIWSTANTIRRRCNNSTGSARLAQQ